jgi:pimeloyl-ACP methyl ester carboxylesterase
MSSMSDTLGTSIRSQDMISKRPLRAEASERWRCEYPFQSNFIDVGGHRMHYLDERESDSARQPTILMVHGNPTWSFYWRRLIGFLRSEYRVVAVDHLGCGFSDKPNDFDYCLSHHIANLKSLIQGLELSDVTLMAHDWGGAIGLGALLALKERFNRVVLFNTGAFPPPYIPWRIRACRLPLLGKLGVQGLNLFARAATVMATEQRGGLPARIAEAYLYPYDSWEHRIAVYQFVKDIPASRRHRTWAVLDEIDNALPQISDWPILLTWGMKDWCFRPECLRRFQSHWPHADVREIESAGHYVVEDAADEVEQAVGDFLLRTASS